jgi:hypothetical protein
MSTETTKKYVRLAGSGILAFFVMMASGTPLGVLILPLLLPGVGLREVLKDWGVFGDHFDAYYATGFALNFCLIWIVLYFVPLFIANLKKRKREQA